MDAQSTVDKSLFTMYIYTPGPDVMRGELKIL